MTPADVPGRWWPSPLLMYLPSTWQNIDKEPPGGVPLGTRTPTPDAWLGHLCCSLSCYNNILMKYDRMLGLLPMMIYMEKTSPWKGPRRILHMGVINAGRLSKWFWRGRHFIQILSDWSVRKMLDNALTKHLEDNAAKRYHYVTDETRFCDEKKRWSVMELYNGE